MSAPKAVFISDVHVNLNTLSLAEAALTQAINKANELEVPLIVSGDLHDHKANIRAECINMMRRVFLTCDQKPYILRGNHCSIHEKSKEHALTFLEDIAHVIAEPYSTNEISFNMNCVQFIPYEHDVAVLAKHLRTIDKGSLIVMHQGIQGSDMGEYIIDKSAIPKELLKDFRVILGHYHSRQDIECGTIKDKNIGLASYVGNPFSLSWGESDDKTKGYQILYSDGSLQFISTGLRSHIVLEIKLGICTVHESARHAASAQDLIWVKLTGTREQLQSYDRQRVAKELGLEGMPFKLDLIPLDGITTAPKTPSLKQDALLDSMIDSITNTSDERKERLKGLWKSLL